MEKADNVIDEYRRTYTSETPHDEVFKDVERLYVTKEAASIVEAYGELAERTLRRHEGMLGFFGSTLQFCFLYYGFFVWGNNIVFSRSGQFSKCSKR